MKNRVKHTVCYKQYVTLRNGSFQALFLWILKLFGRKILTTPSYSLSKMSQKNILKKSRDYHILAKNCIFKFEPLPQNISLTIHAIQNLKVASDRTSQDLLHCVF